MCADVHFAKNYPNANNGTAAVGNSGAKVYPGPLYAKASVVDPRSPLDFCNRLEKFCSFHTSRYRSFPRQAGRCGKFASRLGPQLGNCGLVGRRTGYTQISIGCFVGVIQVFSEG